MTLPSTIDQVKAASVTVLSVATAGAANWMDTANNIIDLLAGVGAVCVTVATVVWYRYKIKQVRRDLNEDE